VAGDQRIKPMPPAAFAVRAGDSIDVRAAISPSMRRSDTYGGFADRRGEISGAGLPGRIEVRRARGPGPEAARRPGRPARQRRPTARLSA